MLLIWTFGSITSEYHIVAVIWDKPQTIPRYILYRINCEYLVLS